MLYLDYQFVQGLVQNTSYLPWFYGALWQLYVLAEAGHQVQRDWLLLGLFFRLTLIRVPSRVEHRFSRLVGRVVLKIVYPQVIHVFRQTLVFHIKVNIEYILHLHMLQLITEHSNLGAGNKLFLRNCA